MQAHKQSGKGLPSKGYYAIISQSEVTMNQSEQEKKALSPGSEAERETMPAVRFDSRKSSGVGHLPMNIAALNAGKNVHGTVLPGITG